MIKPVFIHAGAHRTGTSSFQMCLSQNRETLSGQGYDVAYPGRDGIPGGALRLRLPRPRHGEKRIPQFADQARAHLLQHSPDPARGLILSEENIAGPMHHLYEGRFFPAAAKRARALAQALPAAPRHLVIVLRPYEALFVSAYRKRAEDNAVPPFAELVPRFLAMDFGWPDLIETLRDQLKPDQLTVLRYSQRGQSRDLLVRLVPELANVDLKEPHQLVNQSATDAALEVLQGQYRSGVALDRKDWKKVIEDHAECTARLGVAEFSVAEKARLEARDQSDADRLTRMSGISFC